MKIRGWMNWVMVVGILVVLMGVFVASIGTTHMPPSAEQEAFGNKIAMSGLIAVAYVTLVSCVLRVSEPKGKAASR